MGSNSESIQKLVDFLLTTVSLSLNLSIICLVVTTSFENWRRMDVYVLCLSMVDFLYTLGIPVRTYVTMNQNDWPFGELSKCCSLKFAFAWLV